MDGFFQLPSLEPGTYTLSFSFVGYETLEVPGVQVVAGKVKEINAGLGTSAANLDEVLSPLSPEEFLKLPCSWNKNVQY